jgi:hypothetical protein
MGTPPEVHRGSADGLGGTGLVGGSMFSLGSFKRVEQVMVSMQQCIFYHRIFSTTSGKLAPASFFVGPTRALLECTRATQTLH